MAIVGGGAGGLELATRQGRTLGKKGLADVTLIEKARTHFWKPHLHEMAAGSIDVNEHATDYLAQSHWNGFRYRVGEMVGLDREKRLVQVGPVLDEDGRFHRQLVNASLRAHMQAEPLGPGQLNVAIIGAGATGVELAAELHKVMRTLVSYNLERIDPERIAGSATQLLTKLGVRVRAHARVTSIDAQGVLLASGERIEARAGGVGGGRQGAGLPEGPGRPGDQPPEPVGRRAHAAEHARRARLRQRRLRRRPLAGP
jgi:NADH dehydrogenase